MLSNRQMTILVVAGIVFWFIFAFAIRALPNVFNAGVWNIVLFVLTVPLGWYLVDLTRLLLEHGADPNLTEISGATPLLRAQQYGNSEVAALLESLPPS